jgi:hypothetical protein
VGDALPAPADERVAHEMGMFTVAHLADRQGISVELVPAPDGGLTAEVRLPAGQIVPEGQPVGADAALGAGYGRRGAASAVAGEPRPFPHRITAGPEPPEHAESPDEVRVRLAGFQQGSRRARAVAQLERDAT